MTLTPGTRLGPYEIVAPLGAGGMGEVYRARDPRIGREVAIKILPAAFSKDPDRLRRFEQEAKAAGALNHPNILTIHDIGNHDGAPYVVSELLEGETLRERMGGSSLPARKAIEYAIGIAHGLAAAHAKGIVHRDLKPENIFITKDGRVKILDFGLAKLTHLEPQATDAGDATRSAVTEPGVVMGTIGYMSPEQVRGQPADHRSDLFTFGAILYEMLSGRRAFPGDSAVEVMNAILKEDPPPLGPAHAGLERILRHCLEKSPDERFQSVRDLAFDLESLAGISTPASAVAGAAPSRTRLHPALVAFALVALLAAAFFAGTRMNTKPASPKFRQLTFRRGGILSARFGPDGQTIVYGAAWDGNPIQLFSTRPENPESRPLGLAQADILSISRTGEMAISLGRNFHEWWQAHGTLARAPLAGGAPREVLENIQEADWAPDGSRMAVVRDVGGRSRIEFPVGKVLYEAEAGISHIRISPQGDRVAFIDHPLAPDDTGLVAVVDLAGRKQTLTPRYSSAQGLAWSPAGEEIWFTASDTGVNRAIRAVTVSANPKIRTILATAGNLLLHDVFRDGRALLTRDNIRVGMMGLFPADTKERELSWFDFSLGMDLSPDGRTVLLSEQGEAGGPAYAVYLRKTDGSPAVRLGEGFATALSPDGKWALSILHGPPSQIVLLPTGAGEPKVLARDELEHHQWASWFPDGKRILIVGNERGHGVRLYVRDIDAGKARVISPEGANAFGLHTVSPDGQHVAAITPDLKPALYPVAGGEPRPIPGLSAGDTPVGWSVDARSLFVCKFGEVPAKVYRLDLPTGRKQFWKEMMPNDPSGVCFLLQIHVTPDSKSYIYTYYRLLSDLYLVEGLS